VVNSKVYLDGNIIGRVEVGILNGNYFKVLVCK